MIRSGLAFAALLGLAISSSVAYAGSNCSSLHVDSGKQKVASADGQSKPVVAPTTQKDG
jgi:hypothetical protein